MEHNTVITRRSGRRTATHAVTLPKPAKDYVTGEQFDIVIEGRTVPVHVEIPISDHNERLAVA